MGKLKPEVDIVHDVLLAVKQAKPASTFINSLYIQYIERGGLSKKQLEGLLGHASKVPGIPPAKLATLEAIILKKHSKQKSEVTITHEKREKDPEVQLLIDEILKKYPEHKRVLFFKHNFDQSYFLSPAELEELKRFAKILLKK
ncbi:MAG: hypothetical protein IPL97_02510 [Niastella sp.]|nr:hypothetical protein [Niastella sp.]